jgi:hypothetical protein
VGSFCTFVCVLLLLFCGLSYNLTVSLKADLLEEIIAGFRSSPTDPVRSLAVVFQQHPSSGGCCFSWLGLFESFCYLKPSSAAPGKARLVYGFFETIELFFIPPPHSPVFNKKKKKKKKKNVNGRQ